jgi:hypothetical protein
LEYKAAPALDGSDKHNIDITKDVSSFANSAGGGIVYSMKESDEPAKRHLPEKIDPIDGRKFSREWLDHIVGEIRPPNSRSQDCAHSERRARRLASMLCGRHTQR